MLANIEARYTAAGFYVFPKLSISERHSSFFILLFVYASKIKMEG